MSSTIVENAKCVKHSIDSNRRSKNITFKLVPIDKRCPINQIDDLVVVDVYEGYNKIGRYKIGTLKIKFGF